MDHHYWRRPNGPAHHQYHISKLFGVALTYRAPSALLSVSATAIFSAHH